MISEYNPKRAEALNKLNISDFESADNVKILWCDSVSAENILSRIYTETHSHSFFELHLVFSGNVCYECDGKRMELSENQILFIPGGVPHKFVECSSKMLKTSIAFTLDNLCAVRNIEITFFAEEVTQNLDFVFRNCENGDTLTSGIIYGRILEIIRCVCGNLKIELPKDSENRGDPRVEAAKRFIERNRGRLVSCEDVAKECCISVKQLDRIFKNQTQMSLFGYITESKIKYAKKLLIQRECSIKQIGYMLGFETESGFVSFFKRHCGMPPGEFRKQKVQ